MKEEIIESGCLGTNTVVKRTVEFNATKEQMEYLKSIEDTNEYWDIFEDIKEETNDDDDECMQVTNIEFEKCAARELKGTFQCIVTYSAE